MVIPTMVNQKDQLEVIIHILTLHRDIPIFFRQVIPNKIIIEDDVWIGSNVCILPGVKIRKGAVVGANSVVKANTELEEYTIYAGSPVKKVGIR